MSAEDRIRQQFDAFNRHDPQGWANGYAPNAIVQDPQYPEPLRGPDAIRQDIADFMQAFPDMNFRQTNLLVQGEWVALEGIGTGTHQGPMVGPSGTIAPTNQRVEMAYAVFLRLDGEGRIAEERRYYDQAGLLGQLGLA